MQGSVCQQAERIEHLSSVDVALNYWKFPGVVLLSEFLEQREEYAGMNFRFISLNINVQTVQSVSFNCSFPTCARAFQINTE